LGLVRDARILFETGVEGIPAYIALVVFVLNDTYNFSTGILAGYTSRWAK
jgi:hypothetical protein